MNRIERAIWLTCRAIEYDTTANEPGSKQPSWSLRARDERDSLLLLIATAGDRVRRILDGEPLKDVHDSPAAATSAVPGLPRQPPEP